jgi:hypothetical protein
LNEGIGGVEITTSDGSGVKTWTSGAYTLELRSNGPVTLTATLGQQRFTKSFPAGSENLKFDWIVPEEAQVKEAERCLAKVEGIPAKDGPAFKAAAVELYRITRGMTLDPARQTKIEGLTREVGPEWDRHSQAILNALRSYDPATWPKTLAENRLPYRNSLLDGWFSEAEQVATALGSFQSFERQAKAQRMADGLKRTFLDFLKSRLEALKNDEFRPFLREAYDQAQALSQSGRPEGHKRGS